MRQLGRSATASLDPNAVEQPDLELAVRSRAALGFTRPPPREVVAQAAGGLNTEPMPLLPRRPHVQLPPLSSCEPGARALVARGMGVEEADESD